MIYTNANQLFKELLTIPVTEDSIVHIATYSTYLDISKSKDWSLVYGPSSARELVAKANSAKEFRLIVGAPYFIKDLARIYDYINYYNSLVKRLKMTMEHLKINYVIHDSSHLKYYRIDDRVFIGGINLTSSDWVDVAIEVTSTEQKKELAELFEKTWLQGSTDVDQYVMSVTR